MEGPKKARPSASNPAVSRLTIRFHFSISKNFFFKKEYIGDDLFLIANLNTNVMPNEKYSQKVEEFRNVNVPNQEQSNQNSRDPEMKNRTTAGMKNTIPIEKHVDPVAKAVIPQNE